MHEKGKDPNQGDNFELMTDAIHMLNSMEQVPIITLNRALISNQYWVCAVCAYFFVEHNSLLEKRVSRKMEDLDLTISVW